MGSWQEFEEEILRIFEEHGFKSRKRYVFKDEKGRAEVDILAERFGVILAVDAKRYTEGWYRLSALKREAKKHAERCRRLERVIGKRVIPVVVPLIDDRIYFHHSFIVPFLSLNDFLLNLHYYLVEFGFE